MFYDTKMLGKNIKWFAQDVQVEFVSVFLQACICLHLYLYLCVVLTWKAKRFV